TPRMAHFSGRTTFTGLVTERISPSPLTSEDLSLHPSVNVRGIRLYVAGFITSAAHNTDFVVHAYDGRNGGLLWRDIFDRAGGLDEALDLAVENGRVYAAGFVNADLNSNVFGRA